MLFDLMDMFIGEKVGWLQKEMDKGNGVTVPVKPYFSCRNGDSTLGVIE